MIIHVGDVEELNTVLDDVDETVASAASKSRRKLIGARTMSGQRLKLKESTTMDSGESANMMPMRMAMTPTTGSSRTWAVRLQPQHGRGTRRGGGHVYRRGRQVPGICRVLCRPRPRMIHKAPGRMSKFRRQKNIWILDALVSVDQGFTWHGTR